MSEENINKVYLTVDELKIINSIVEENEIKTSILVLQNDGSGIGHLTDVEFEADMHGRIAYIRIPITTVDNW